MRPVWAVRRACSRTLPSATSEELNILTSGYCTQYKACVDIVFVVQALARKRGTATLSASEVVAVPSKPLGIPSSTQSPPAFTAAETPAALSGSSSAPPAAHDIVKTGSSRSQENAIRLLCKSTCFRRDQMHASKGRRR